jgi:hypothetical protein
VSDQETARQDERKAAEDDAKEDLELTDETADQVRGGTAGPIKLPPGPPFQQ